MSSPAVRPLPRRASGQLTRSTSCAPLWDLRSAWSASATLTRREARRRAMPWRCCGVQLDYPFRYGVHAARTRRLPPPRPPWSPARSASRVWVEGPERRHVESHGHSGFDNTAWATFFSLLVVATSPKPRVVNVTWRRSALTSHCTLQQSVSLATRPLAAAAALPLCSDRRSCDRAPPQKPPSPILDCATGHAAGWT